MKNLQKILAIIGKKRYNNKSIKFRKGGNKNPALMFWIGGYMANIEEKIENLIKHKVELIGYDLYDVLYIKEGKNYILRIVIDSKKGITLDDCEKVNNEITDILDEADYIKEQYFLEVSSPGIERILRKTWQLKKYINSPIQINLFKKDENGFKEYRGILKHVEEQYLDIIQEQTEYKIQRKDISQVKTIYEEGEM